MVFFTLHGIYLFCRFTYFFIDLLTSYLGRLPQFEAAKLFFSLKFEI